MLRKTYKKIVIFLDITAIVAFIIMPSLFFPSYLFNKGTSSVAVIGSPRTFIIFSSDGTQWGNIVFPICILLLLTNLFFIFTFFYKIIKE